VSVKIQIKRANASAWTAANPTLAAGEWGMELDTKKLKLGTGALWNSTDYYSETLTLNSVGDVTITSLQNGDFLRYSSSASAWINDPVNLSTDTVGDYVQSLVAGTGVTVTNNSGEGTTPTVAIGQAVSTSSSVTFAHVSAPVTGNVTGNLTGNADTAATLQTPRTISLSGDVSGSVSFNGSANVDIAATVQPNSVALGTDTTGNYMSDLTQGTGVSITHTPGEGSNATIAIGQAVGTSSSVQFASVTAPLTGNASTATALETARNISLTGDVSGSVSFNGTSDVSISATVQPNSVALGTDTTGNYVNDLTQGTGVTVTHTPGEGSSPTVAIGQDVATSASVTFAHVSAPVTGSVTGNASTATTLQTGRTISLSGDVSGSVSFDGSADATISATIQPNSVALGTDTTGNYVNDVAAGTGVTVTHTPAEGSSPTIAIGQDVATSASVSFARLETTGNVVIGGNLTVNGDTTTLNTETLSVEDNTIVLNSNATGSPTLNAGIEVERGDSANVSVRWNESTDSWELTEDGSTYKNIAVGQDVETSASVTFAAVTAELVGNSSTSSALKTPRTIALSGDVSGSVSFDGSANVDITATVQPNSVALGTDTTGNYVNDVTAGTGVTVTHTPGEGTSPTIAIGQAVGTSASVTFANVTADLVGDVTGNASTASALETARTISLAGDLSGSASFNGTSDITISASVVNSGVSLDEISDVVITSPLQFQGLMYDGTNWVNSNIPDTYLVRNNTGSTILKGTLVGAVGAEPSGRIDVAPFEVTGTENSELRAMGIVTSNISSGVNGAVMSFGTLTGLDTRGDTASALAVGDETWAAGDILFAHPTVAGKLTNIKPQHDLAVAFITVRHASAGQIAIRIIPGNNHLEWMHDVVLSSPTDGQFLRYNSASTVWVNDSINLGTDTVGDYVASLVAGTGITLSNNSGESASPTIAIGQDVGTSASVTFAHVSAPITGNVTGNVTGSSGSTTGNAATATALQNARTISLSGDVSGSVSFDGTSNVSISATVEPNSVALGTDTTGNYVNDLTAGTGVSITHTPAEGSSPTVAIGQSVATSASVTFAKVDTTGDITVGGNLTVNGTTTTLNTETLAIEDNIVVLNSNVTGSPATNAGIEVERGDSANVVLRWNESTDKWETTNDGSAYSVIATNGNIALGTDTTGNYVNDLTAGTGVTVTHTPGEGSSPTVAIGQAVGTSSSVQFAAVTAPLIGNASTATTLATSRTIELTGDVTGSVSFDGSANASISATIAANSVALGTDTTGNYVNDLTAGTGVTVTHTPGEGTSPTVAIGQSVGTSASVTFAAVTAPVIGNASTASTLETARTISLTGDVSGSVSFNGSADASISATIQPNSVALGTDTTGNYVNDLTAGTGVTVTHTPGEGSSPTVAIGQAVGTSSSVTFAAVTAPLIGNASTATALQTARNIAGQSFDGSANISIAPTDLTGVTSTAAELNILDGATLSTTELNYVDGVTSAIQTQIDAKAPSASPTFTGVVTLPDNTVALGTKTTGDYVASLVAGTGVTLTNNSGETATPTVAIGQAVGTSASVTFAKVDTTGDITVGGNLTVNGTTTTLNTETLAIEDNIVVLNSNVTSSPTTNAGIEVERGTSANVSLRWNETSDKWELTEDGSAFYDIATEDFVLAQSVASLSDIGDVTASTAAAGDFLKYNGAAWVNDPINLGTDTTGNYMSGITAGTGLTVSHTPGEGSSASVSLNATLDDLNGVNAPSLTDGDILKFISRPTSYIGTTWTTRRSHFGNTSIRSIAHGNSLWVAAGYTGQLRTSTDAITWTTRTSTFDSGVIHSVAYGNNLWVAVGDSGQLRSSTDGTTWTTRTSNFGNSIIRSVAYGNSLWVAGGYGAKIATSTDAITWTTRTSNFTDAIFSIAYGNNLWVAAGYIGELRTSTDAITWTTRTSNFGFTQIRSVAYGNNLWVAGGYAAQLRTSTDAITWTTRTSNFASSQIIRSLVYSNSLWVAVADEGQLRTSTDAVTWTTQTSNFGNASIRSIAYGDNTLVAGGDLGKLRTSADSAAFVEWVPVSLDLDDIGDVVITNPSNGNPLVYDNSTSTWKKGTNYLSLDGNDDTSYLTLDTTNGLNVNTGTSNTSAEYAHDGITISDNNGPTPVQVTLTANNGLNITDSSNNYVNLSTTSIRFSTPGNAASYYINPLSASVGQVFAVVANQYSEPGGTFSPTTLNLDSLGDVSASSPADGNFLKYVSASAAWVPASIPTINALDDIGDVSAASPTTGHFLKWNGSAWVPAAAGAAATTTTIATTSATEIFSFDPTLHGTAEVTLQIKQGAKKTSSRALVNHDGSSTALLTQYAKLEHGSPVIPVTLAANYDRPAASWTTRTSNFGTTRIYSVAYGNNLWVAGGDYGQIRASTDAVTWTTRTSNFGNTHINSIAYGNNIWVAVGNDGQLRTSTDAITWTTRASDFSPSYSAIRSVAYGNVWVAGGDYGQIRTSTDAITWEGQTSNFGNTTVASLAYGNNLWVAGGFNGQLRTSTDAITWEVQTSNFSPYTIRSVAYANSLWVAVASGGALRTSTDGTTWVTRTSNFGGTSIRSVAFGNNLWVAAGYYGEIRKSTDAITWTTITSNFGATTHINSVAYGNSLWVAAGYSGQLRTSVDSDKVIVTATITDANVTTATSKATLVLTEE